MNSARAEDRVDIERNPEFPYFVMVPDTLKSVSFIEKDTNKFPDTSGWAYAQFLYDAASDTFTPNGIVAKCGYACHATVAAKITISRVSEEVKGLLPAAF